MAKAMQVLLFLSLVICTAEGFTTKKKERRSHFPPASRPKEQQYSTDSTTLPFVPGSLHGQVVQYIDPHEEEDDVSYSVALVSCMLSLAVGFGLGYGT